MQPYHTRAVVTKQRLVFETQALQVFQRERDYQRHHLPEKSVTPGCWLFPCFRTRLCTWKLQHYAKSCEGELEMQGMNFPPPLFGRSVRAQSMP